MAGLAGYIHRDSQILNLKDAMSCLCHTHSMKIRIEQQTDKVTLGSVFRVASEISFHKNDETGLSVLLYGLALVSNGSELLKIDAERIALGYSSGGKEFFKRLDGSFVIVLLDSDRLIILSDPAGTCPVCYCKTDRGIAFAPEAKALIRLFRMKPEISYHGSAGFILNGYPLGKYTMFENVYRLCPGEMLTVEIDKLDSSVKKYRDLDYTKRSNLSLNASADLLFEKLIEAHKAVLIDQPENIQIALTGGFDSRAMLGILTKLKQNRIEAFTWGETNKIQGSDPLIAKQLSAIAGINHRFFSYKANDFLTNAESWLLESELMSDNIGHFAAGSNRLSYDSGTKILIGDHILGNSGFPLDFEQAVAGVTGIDLQEIPNSLRIWMSKQESEDLMSSYIKQIHAISDNCNSDHPKNIQHYLEFHLGTFGWLLAPGYYKEPIYAARRPMLLADMTDFACQLSPELRIGKPVLLRMLKRYMPDLMKLPKSSSFSLVDWRYSMRKDKLVGKFFQNLLEPTNLEDIPFIGSRNTESLHKWLDKYWNTHCMPITRERKNFDPLMRTRDRLMRTKSTRMILRKMSKKKAAGPNSQKMIQRAALLSFFKQSIDNEKYN